MGEIGSHPCPSLDQNWTLYPVFLLAPPPALGPALAGACSRELPPQGHAEALKLYLLTPAFSHPAL